MGVGVRIPLLTKEKGLRGSPRKLGNVHSDVAVAADGPVLNAIDLQGNIVEHEYSSSDRRVWLGMFRSVTICPRDFAPVRSRFKAQEHFLQKPFAFFTGRCVAVIPAKSEVAIEERLDQGAHHFLCLRPRPFLRMHNHTARALHEYELANTAIDTIVLVNMAVIDHSHRRQKFLPHENRLRPDSCLFRFVTRLYVVEIHGAMMYDPYQRDPMPPGIHFSPDTQFDIQWLWLVYFFAVPTLLLQGIATTLRDN